MNTVSNYVQLIGYLGADPEVKTFDKSQKVSFNLATNESRKDDNGEYVTTTYWHNCVAWGKPSELISKLLKKGHQVVINGKITYRGYEDKNGVKRTSTEVVIRDFLKLTKDNKVQAES